MKIKDLTNFFLKKYPLSKQEAWDQSGITIKAKLNQTLKNCLVCLDVNDEIVTYAYRNKINLIISHHPLFKNKINRPILNKLRINKITYLSLHTCFDNSKKGMNFLIAKELKLQEINWVKHNKSYFPFGCFAKRKKVKEIITLFKKKFYCPYIFTNVKNTNKTFKYLALCAGAGYQCLIKNFNTIKWKNTLFVTGDLKYHNWMEINQYKLNFLDVGHELENFFVNHLANEIKNNYPQIKIKKVFSKQTKFLIN